MDGVPTADTHPAKGMAVAWSSRLSSACIMALLGLIFAALYAAFIFSGQLIEYMAPAVTLLLWGGAVLMLLTMLVSGISGVFASIQDEAVVILAAVATAIVADLGGVIDDVTFATILGAIACSTLFTGFTFYLLGLWRLGRLIRYVPFSVTAGFLITIGWLLIVVRGHWRTWLKTLDVG